MKHIQAGLIGKTSALILTAKIKKASSRSIFKQEFEFKEFCFMCRVFGWIFFFLQEPNLQGKKEGGLKALENYLSFYGNGDMQNFVLD